MLAAMSGGVDSSVAAALCLERGYEVWGVTMRLWTPEVEDTERTDGCCSISAVEDARAVCAKLDIPHYVVNLKAAFRKHVVDDFVREYASGRTPNPCIRCNEHVKFRHLLRKAVAVGADLVCTGHYARIEPFSGGWVLRVGRDSAKDQSYFLYTLTQQQMAHVLFPNGELTKAEVRAKAREFGLRVAEKAESQEVCFVLDERAGEFVAARAPEAGVPGEIVDAAGNVLGRHRGIAHYTVGQRRGLGVGGGRRLYVTAVDAGARRVIVGEEARLWVSRIRVSQLHWTVPQPPPGPSHCTVRIRYNSRGGRGRVMPNNCGGAIIKFDEPQRAVAPGQAAVFYDGDMVLGGGTIEERLD